MIYHMWQLPIPYGVCNCTYNQPFLRRANFGKSHCQITHYYCSAQLCFGHAKKLKWSIVLSNSLSLSQKIENFNLKPDPLLQVGAVAFLSWHFQVLEAGQEEDEEGLQSKNK